MDRLSGDICGFQGDDVKNGLKFFVEHRTWVQATTAFIESKHKIGNKIYVVGRSRQIGPPQTYAQLPQSNARIPTNLSGQGQGVDE